MTSPFWKPNLKGVLIFLSALFVVLNLFPTPNFRYSAMTYRFSVSWPWPWPLAVMGSTLLLYALSMRAGSALPAQGSARLLTGPLLIIPLGLLIAIAVGFFIYVPPEIHGPLERHAAGVRKAGRGLSAARQPAQPQRPARGGRNAAASGREDGSPAACERHQPPAPAHAPAPGRRSTRIRTGAGTRAHACT